MEVAKMRRRNLIMIAAGLFLIGPQERFFGEEFSILEGGIREGSAFQ